MKAKKLLFVLLIIFFLTPLHLSAQSSIFYPGLKLDLPLFDFPYQKDAMNTVDHGFFGSYANPSMNQSLALATDLISGFNFGMQYFYDNSKINETMKGAIYFAGLGLGSLLLTYSPGGDGWLHEEYHRAVMTHYGINSFNGMNLFPVGAEIVSVDHIKDEDLIRLKAKSPADMVRLHAAGIEGEYLLINNLQRNNFFYEQRLPNYWMYWMITVNSHFYLFMSASPTNVDEETAKMNKLETTIASRDFTGFDMTGWVYDLFRPDEPYEARGVHPSGVGINRYRTTKDLTDEELNYLIGQVYLHFVNYLSPMLYGFQSIPLGNNGLTGNFAMRHLLTSFGSDVSAHIFLKYYEYFNDYEYFNVVFVFHNYFNYKNYFPAIEAELIDYPIYLGDFGMFFSPRIIIGMQPEDQKFKTEKREFLGLFGLRIDFIISKNFLPFVDFTAKTDGWVAGNVYLDKNVSCRVGVSLRF
jgi:hypothetical protein